MSDWLTTTSPLWRLRLTIKTFCWCCALRNHVLYFLSLGWIIKPQALNYQMSHEILSSTEHHLHIWWLVSAFIYRPQTFCRSSFLPLFYPTVGTATCFLFSVRSSYWLNIVGATFTLPALQGFHTALKRPTLSVVWKPVRCVNSHCADILGKR